MISAKPKKVVHAGFYRKPSGSVPPLEWLRNLPDADSKVIGRNIKTIEFAWPVGMPLCRPMGGGLYELRSSLAGGRIARMLFCFNDGEAFFLHGFIKKSQKTPKSDLDLAIARMKEVKNAR